ncbi:zinc-binding dehydrogenase [Marisediminicola sp. LYQ134]|uniref:zinc-binding dehydrogenase n=1 Tax=unclassified Marisediminicola TaxID=2618316 RepID=UPI003983B9E3
MKAAILHAPFDIRVAEVPDPQLSNTRDAVVRITRSSVCGSDLWNYRGINDVIRGSRIGHESMGVVEAVGRDVRSVAVGDIVLLPFAASDGTCPECLAGFPVACRNAVAWGRGGYDGGQGEKIRVPFADVNCFAVPDDGLTDSMLTALLPLTDVLSTGHHAALCARVEPGSTVVVVGDGAVGLCGVAASRRLGAGRIILVSTRADRAAVGRDFGATDVVAARGGAAVARVRDLTGDLGADSVLECVGTDDAFGTALGAVRKGGDVGFVGVPHGVRDLGVSRLFRAGIGVKGSPAPVARYIRQLMPDVLAGSLDVSAIFDLTVSLDDIAAGYRAMDERTAVKALVRT